ncbi:MAG: pilus assembly protein, partial [Actinobacteria bacterium]|nr:pilus assembly protein [Actinomycetota bacterium]NIS36920.1 pilus assembly protein [Actinomycetota bacterium]NIT97437.1 pilus assembly protein [Actinomycetota bacterium]NIU21111.1 pilus assembly protein [Actinomycetota bacterium]NIU71400.1 pilus assembly protein [Actinomycetota bacterium]
MSRLRGDEGAALVEFALILPFLLVVMLGTITSGFALNDDIQLTHSAREGARYGATVPEDETFTTGT